MHSPLPMPRRLRRILDRAGFDLGLAHRCPVSGQSAWEETLNVFTHRVGFMSAVAGFLLMVTLAAIYGTATHVVATGTFSSLLVVLFLVSMQYHGSEHLERKRLYRVLDHVAIFLVIAGSYTPFMLVLHDHPVGWPMFWGMWAMAATGTVIKLFFTGRFRTLSTLMYLGMGWSMVVVMEPLAAALPPGGLELLIAGGVFYTVGVVFFLWQGLPFAHTVWHLFVMGGSTCHYFAVMLLLAAQTGMPAAG